MSGQLGELGIVELLSFIQPLATGTGRLFKPSRRESRAAQARAALEHARADAARRDAERKRKLQYLQAGGFAAIAILIALALWNRR